LRNGWRNRAADNPERRAPKGFLGVADPVSDLSVSPVSFRHLRIDASSPERGPAPIRARPVPGPLDNPDSTASISKGAPSAARSGAEGAEDEDPSKRERPVPAAGLSRERSGVEKRLCQCLCSLHLCSALEPGSENRFRPETWSAVLRLGANRCRFLIALLPPGRWSTTAEPPRRRSAGPGPPRSRQREPLPRSPGPGTP
jgi:hypothetical protein